MYGGRHREYGEHCFTAQDLCSEISKANIDFSSSGGVKNESTIFYFHDGVLL